ncbi:hypothetical protein K461DRAFT_294672 [Myriangium duriaei CBS 260.36]|uniref:Uncharacterized protein n=1 Tax=Myriangium duriaei CBS 260.36 TaxID=1168546 RepID=A0A9P4J3N5_9PEZI|nr:hypothetical protein K461DRAFT_294672 [Myriangium duriaei CBS 260.36]
MSTVRDPAFWKRFSTAVHLNDVESTADSSRPKLEHQDSWLARQEKKKKRRTIICWAFWIGLFSFVAIVIIVVVLLANAGVFKKLQKSISNTSS